MAEMDTDALGPVDYLVFVRHSADGSITEVIGDELEGDERLALFRGVSSGLLGSDDLREVAKILPQGAAAGILVYENRWAAPLVAALRRGRADVVASGRIPHEDLFAAATADTEDRPWG